MQESHSRWALEGGHNSYKQLSTLPGKKSHPEQMEVKTATFGTMLDLIRANAKAPEDGDAEVVVKLRRAPRHALTDALGAAALSSAPTSGRLTPRKATASFHC